LNTHPIPIAGEASLMIDRGITEGNDCLLNSPCRPFSIFTDFDVPDRGRFERLGWSTTAGGRI
jgi:hypothetical protein